jgi:hypothetical protein
LLLRGAPAASAADIRVWIEPAQAKAEFSAEFTVQVMIENVTDLGYFQFNLEYDPRVVLPKGAVLGDFLGSTGRSASGLGPRFDNSTGILTFGGFSFGTTKGPNGKGVLAAVTFTGLARGLSPLRLKNVLISDSQNQALTGFTVQDGVAAIGGAAVVTSEPTATPVMVTMTPLSSPTAVRTDTPEPPASAVPGATGATTTPATPVPEAAGATTMPATPVPGATGATTAQATSPSEPLLTATISPASTVSVVAATTVVPPAQAGTMTPTAAGAAPVIPAAPSTADGTGPTAVAGAGYTPIIAPPSATPALVAGNGQELTRASTSTPILSGRESQPQAAKAPGDDSARGLPTWLVAAGIGMISLASAGLVILVLFVVRYRKGA